MSKFFRGKFSVFISILHLKKKNFSKYCTIKQINDSWILKDYGGEMNDKFESNSNERY